MLNTPANVNTEVSTNSARVALSLQDKKIIYSTSADFSTYRVSLSKHLPAGFHHTLTFPHLNWRQREREREAIIHRAPHCSSFVPHHADDWASGHEFDQPREEWLVLQIAIVLL